MKINFDQLTSPNTRAWHVDPRQLFMSLPGKGAGYGYLRDVQAEVLEQWHAKRGQRDLRVKMNTGGGKTLVGLLILQSSLNEGMFPAVYVAPSPYLVRQVLDEARALGLTTDTEPRSIAVLRGKAVLVTSIHTLLNGRSKFGVGDSGVKIPIGSLVLDDAHACLATAEQQFTIELGASSGAYGDLLKLFSADLESQHPAKYAGLANGDPYKIAQVPFWAWQSRIAEVREILHKHSEENGIKFSLPLLDADLHLCRCVFGGSKVEISPRCLPVRSVPSFVEAKRRVFMSATFADDGILVSHFDASPEEISLAVAPKNASDLGERMILIPQELNPSITDDELRGQAIEWAAERNVVVIVPSHKRATYWSEAGAEVLDGTSLEEGVARLREGRVGLVVIVNRYDGIDLPENACRVLILDGLPDARRLVDKLDEACLKGTTLATGEFIQRLEQGMGRGVRSNSDHCAVILMGRTLIGNLFLEGGVDQLTPANRAQYDLSDHMGNQLRGRSLSEMADVVESYCFLRNPEWVSAAKDALAGVTYATVSANLDIAAGRRRAWDDASDGDLRSSVAVLTDLRNKQVDERVQGWLLAEAAEYQNPLDEEKAQNIIRSATQKNRQVPLRSKEGLDYQRMTAVGEQAAASLRYIRDSFKDANASVLAAHAVAEDLAYRPDSYKRFERALAGAAGFLGFASQMPEDEFGAGPDVLWSLGKGHYWVIECKNEAVNEAVSKYYCNQLAGSFNWFTKKYGTGSVATPVLFHPSRTFEFAASSPPGCRVVTKDKMAALKDAFLGFAVALSAHHAVGTEREVSELLARYKLASNGLLSSFSEEPRYKAK